MIDSKPVLPSSTNAPSNITTTNDMIASLQAAQTTSSSRSIMNRGDEFHQDEFEYGRLRNQDEYVNLMELRRLS